MPDEEKLAYIEDLEEKPKEEPATVTAELPASSQASSVVDDAAPSSPSKEKEEMKTSKSAASTSTTTGKRQRNIMDMFPKKDGPAVKKTRLASGTAATTDGAGSSTGARAVNTGTTLNSIPFSKSEYEGSFNEEESRLLKLECDTMGLSWLKILKDEIRKPYFLQLKRFLWEEGVTGAEPAAKLKIFPAPKNIYSWSNTPLGRVKCVLVGQDPYHGPGQAHGLCFSVPPNVTVPPSLRNIYAELKNEYPEFEPPKHGNLSSWAEDGVLMLNTCLTVRAREAGSHAGKGWETFTSAVVEAVDKYGGANLGAKTGHGRGVVFLAWGSWAAKRVAGLDRKKHLILTSAHPSPFSAHKGFLGNGHFKKANDWLETKYGSDGCINWTKL